MKFNLVKEGKIKGVSGPVKEGEEDNGWAWWGLFEVVIVTEVIAVLKMLGKI